MSDRDWRAIKFTYTDYEIWDVDQPRADQRFSVLEDLQEDDAYLIAAAPKLLAACQQAIKHFAGDDPMRRILLFAIRDAHKPTV